MNREDAKNAIAEYHELCAKADLAAESFVRLAERERSLGLLFPPNDRLLCNVLRPRFLTAEDYEFVRATTETILRAFERLYQALMREPALRASLALTPDEETVVALDPGYPALSSSGRLDAFYDPATRALHFIEFNAESPTGLAYQNTLAELFTDLPLMRGFAERYRFHFFPTRARLLDTLLETYRTWGGQSRPHIAIVDWTGLSTASEFRLFEAYFLTQGYEAIITTPQELDYRRGRLRSGDFDIDLVYKRVLIGELLERYGTHHPLIDAVRDHAVCMVNSFRSKLLHKKASLAMLSDERHQNLYTADQLIAIERHIPWTRRVEERTTLFHGRSVDLVPFVLDHPQDLILKPNDDYGGKGVILGHEVSAAVWAEAVQSALVEPYVVQERVPIPTQVFPVYNGRVELVERSMDLDPFIFHSRETLGALSRLSTQSLMNVSAGGGSEAPTFVLDGRL